MHRKCDAAYGRVARYLLSAMPDRPETAELADWVRVPTSQVTYFKLLGKDRISRRTSDSFDRNM